MPLPQHAANNDTGHLHLLVKVARRVQHFVGQAEATHDKGAICRPSESLGQDVPEGRVLGALCVGDRLYEGHQCAVQHLCRSKIDQTTNVASRNSQYQQCFQRNHSPPRCILGPLAQVTRVDPDTGNLRLGIRKRLEISEKYQGRAMVQETNRALDLAEGL